ncbi:MAG TPA: LUD domain-containing protein [Dongiaceae bacterium]|jgi:L-lactate dehydrogenase complex protein LldG|nr:LUD domain-containing protein [Dongiaceae bacterium]
MNSRETIFARLREALSLPAPAHHGTGLPTVAEQRQVLPPVPETAEAQLALFAQNATELRATFQRVKHPEELATALRALRDANNWRRVATHRSPLAQAQAGALDLPTLVTETGCDKHQLEQCDVGITECDALIAQTGTVLVTSRSAGGRALTCLPPHHVVIARREQLVPDLPAALARLREIYSSQWPSMISFITGPSRTGDIERILVLGAHGPKQLTIFCLD